MRKLRVSVCVCVVIALFSLSSVLLSAERSAPTPESGDQQNEPSSPPKHAAIRVWSGQVIGEIADPEAFSLSEMIIFILVDCQPQKWRHPLP